MLEGDGSWPHISIQLVHIDLGFDDYSLQELDGGVHADESKKAIINQEFGFEELSFPTSQLMVSLHACMHVISTEIFTK